MSETTPGDGPDPALDGPGSGAAKPVTEPPGGAVDRVLNEEDGGDGQSADQPDREVAADNDEAE